MKTLKNIVEELNINSGESYKKACDRVSILMNKELNPLEDEYSEMTTLLKKIDDYQKINYKIESDDLPDNMDAGDLMYGKEESSQIIPELNGLLIDFDAVETIKEAADKYFKESAKPYYDDNFCINDFITGAKSDSAKNYWYQQFIKEQSKQFKQEKS